MRTDYLSATKYYFDCIIGPFKPFMSKALERVGELDLIHDLYRTWTGDR